MKKIVIVAASLLNMMLLSAQGIYQLWGMTAYGGPDDAGVIFKTDKRGNNFQGVYNFSLTTGQHPYGSLTFYNGKLYGMMSYGGTYNAGALFEIDPITNAYTERLSLPADANGGTGNGTLVLYGNKLYGVGAGGTNSMGVIFEWDPATNIYTKKIDFTGISGSAPGRLNGNLTLVGNKFIGTTAGGGVDDAGVLFEWDPATNIYTKKIDFTGGDGAYPSPYDQTLELKDGKLYGTGISGGEYGQGIIFEWDPGADIYTKKLDFGIQSAGAEGASPFSGLTLSAGKFYGMTLDGGMSALGVVYEWDPLTNIYTVKQDLDGENTGRNPNSRLSAFGGYLYGMIGYGGINDRGLLFELDPINNIFSKKIDFDGINAGATVEGNKITVVPAPVAAGVPGSCTTYPAVIIDNNNNNEWVPIVDNLGHAIAEIKANGNNLGIVNTQVYIQNGTVREDAAHIMYLDRSITITPQIQPATPVDIRLYIRESELETLKMATNSLGLPSRVHTIGDLGLFKNEDVCNSSLIAGAAPVETTSEPWLNGYVLTATVNSFSSFYFANNANAALPLNFLSFKGKIVNNDAVLTWKTDNEINSSRFEIEKSLDGRTYNTAGSVNAFNTPGVHQYSFTDVNAATAGSRIIYYRLKQTDIDGRFTYSIVVIVNAGSNPAVLFYPNPVTNKANLSITVDVPQLLQLRTVDNLGRVVKRQQWNLPTGSTSLSVDVNGLISGLYYLELKGQTVSKQLCFLKQ